MSQDLPSLVYLESTTKNRLKSWVFHGLSCELGLQDLDFGSAYLLHPTRSADAVCSRKSHVWSHSRCQCEKATAFHSPISKRHLARAMAMTHNAPSPLPRKKKSQTPLGPTFLVKASQHPKRPTTCICGGSDSSSILLDTASI